MHDVDSGIVFGLACCCLVHRSNVIVMLNEFNYGVFNALQRDDTEIYIDEISIVVFSVTHRNVYRVFPTFRQTRHFITEEKMDCKMIVEENGKGGKLFSPILVELYCQHRYRKRQKWFSLFQIITSYIKTVLLLQRIKL